LTEILIFLYPKLASLTCVLTFNYQPWPCQLDVANITS